MKIPLALSISLLSVTITLPPRTAVAETAPTLRDKVTWSLRNQVTKVRGVKRRLCYRVQHAALAVKEKFDVRATR